MNLFFRATGKHFWDCHFNGTGLVVSQNPCTSPTPCRFCSNSPFIYLYNYYWVSVFHITNAIVIFDWMAAVGTCEYLLWWRIMIHGDIWLVEQGPTSIMHRYILPRRNLISYFSNCTSCFVFSIELYFLFCTFTLLSHVHYSVTFVFDQLISVFGTLFLH